MIIWVKNFNIVKNIFAKSTLVANIIAVNTKILLKLPYYLWDKADMIFYIVKNLLNKL